MKQLRGSSASDVVGSQERCFSVLADVESYGRWYPEAIRRVQVLERSGDGQATKISAILRAEVGPLAREFDLLLSVATDPPRSVSLTRLPYEPSDRERFEVKWTILAGPPVRIELELEAELEVPRLLPLGDIGESLATGFVTAAAREASSS